MKKPVAEYTDEELKQRLAFAARLECGSPLPFHLESEKQELLAEQRRRKTAIDGEGI